MLWRIARRELREHLTSLRFGATFALALLLMGTSALVFSMEYRTAVREYPRQIRGLVNKEGKTHLQLLPCSGGNSVLRVPSPLAFCAGTGERELPDQVGFAVHGLKRVARKGDVEGILGGGARVDWAYVIAVLLSFAAGLLTYRSIAGDLQDGTLSLMLSNPVSRGAVLAGKYLASLLALTASVAVAVVFGLLVLQLTAPIHFSADDWLKILFMGGATLLYLSCFVLIGLLCSVFSRNTTIAAIAFLFNWAFLVFVVPNLAGVVAGRLDDVMTPFQVREAARGVSDRLPFKPGMSADEVAATAVQQELARERLLLEHIQGLEHQVRLGQSLARLSPAATFTYAVEEATGGGLLRFSRFVDNAVRCRREVFQAILEADKEDPESEHRYKPGSCGGPNFSHRTVDLGPAKEFRDPPPSSVEGLQAAFIDLMLLVLYNGVLFLVTYLRFVRQDVTPGSAL